MEFPPNQMQLFTTFIMGKITNNEFVDLLTLWYKKQKAKKEKETE